MDLALLEVLVTPHNIRKRQSPNSAHAIYECLFCGWELKMSLFDEILYPDLEGRAKFDHFVKRGL